MNIVVEYLYRDAGNNKIWNDVIFSNRMSIDVALLELNIKDALIDGEFFVAENVGLPSLRFENHDDELDHGWHEYHSVKETETNINSDINCDICDFVGMLSLSKLFTEGVRGQSDN